MIKVRILLLILVFTITTSLFPYRGLLINHAQAASIVVDSGSQTYKTTTHKIEEYGFSVGLKQKIQDGSKDYIIRLHYRLPSGAPTLLNRIYAKLDSTIFFDTKVAGAYSGYIDVKIPDTGINKSYEAITMMVDLNGSAKTGDSELRYEVFYEDVTPPTKPTMNGAASNWSTSAFISMSGSNDTSGISKYMYRIDNGEYKEYSNPFLAPEGQHMIEAYAVDTNGLQSEHTMSKSFVDSTSPTSPTINGGGDQWYSNNIDIDFTSGIDSQSGVNRTEYYLSGATSTLWKNTNLATISNEGITTIHVRTIDNAGNISQEAIGTVKIDRTRPDLVVTEQKLNPTTLRFIAKATDESSGIKSITLPDGSIVNSNTAIFDTKINGEYTFIATDIVGMTATQTQVISNLDEEPPVLNITYDKSYAKSIVIQVSAEDNDTGIQEIVLPDGSIIFSNQAETVIKENGTYLFKAVDVAGNVTEKSIIISMIDTQKPSMDIFYSDLPQPELTFKIIANDNESGIDFMTMPDGVKVEKETFQYTISENGTYTFSTRDKAGNIYSKTIIIKNIDTVLPTIDVDYNQTIFEQSISINITTEDNQSGIDFITLPDGKNVYSYKAQYTAHDNGKYFFKVTDKAGNTNLKWIEVQNVDHIEPEIKVNSNGSAWTDQPIQLLISYQDLDSGLDVNKLYYKLTKSESSPETWRAAEKDKQQLSITEEGEWYLHAMATDQAGNKKIFTSKKYQLQKQPEIPNLQVKGVSSQQIQLDWKLSNSASITDGYTYYIHNQETGQKFKLMYPQNSLIDVNLKGGELYHYTIQAQNHVGASLESKPVNGYTLPDATTYILIDKQERDYDKALVTFSPVQSALAYHIQAINMNDKQVHVDTTVTGNVYQEISGLKPYTFYNIVVTAINNSGSGLPYHVSYLSLPSAPTGFRFLQMTENSIMLDWNTVTKSTYTTSSVQEDTYYSLKRSNTYIYQGPDTRFIDNGLNSGTAFDYSIAAGNLTGWSNYSYLSNIWTLPSIVGRLEQVDAQSHSLFLNWQSVRGATGYNIMVENIGEYNISGDITHFEIKELEPGYTYRTTITPYNTSGNGRSKEILITTLPLSISNESIRIKNITEHDAVIEIIPVKGANKYRLEIDGREYVLPAGDFKIPALTGATYYEYSISSGNSVGWTEPMTGKLLTSPSIPNDIKLTHVTDQSISLSWKPIANVDTYTIYDKNKKEIKIASEEKAVITNLNAGEIYDLYIAATNKNGTSALHKLTYRTLPESGLKDKNKVQISNITINSVDIQWGLMKGADQYQLYDDANHLLYETTSNMVHLENLSSATLYKGWYIVPVNTTGKGESLEVLSFETLPSDRFKIIESDSTKSTVTLKIEHVLSKETIVIEINNEIVFRGLDHTFMKDKLKPDQLYIFKVWTENGEGQVSPSVTTIIRTKKEKVKKIIDIKNEERLQEANVIHEIATIPEKNDYLSKNNNDQEFKDIDSIFSKSQIKELHQLGIIEGVNPTHFEPEREVTRAEFMALIVRGKRYLNNNIPLFNTTKKVTFNDVDWNAWYMPELNEALSNNYVKGFSESIFAPTLTINREQASKMIVNAVIGNVEDSIALEQFAFSDVALISQWATGSILKGYKEGILLGYPNHSFQPKRNLTRAEAAMLLYRMVIKK